MNELMLEANQRTTEENLQRSANSDETDHNRFVWPLIFFFRLFVFSLILLTKVEVMEMSDSELIQTTESELTNNPNEIKKAPMKAKAKSKKAKKASELSSESEQESRHSDPDFQAPGPSTRTRRPRKSKKQ